MCHCIDHKERQFKYSIMRWLKFTKHIHCHVNLYILVVKLVVPLTFFLIKNRRIVARDYLVMFREEKLIKQ